MFSSSDLNIRSLVAIGIIAVIYTVIAGTYVARPLARLVAIKSYVILRIYN